MVAMFRNESCCWMKIKVHEIAWNDYLNWQLLLYSSQEKFDAWTDRIFDAPTLEAVFQDQDLS